VTVSDPIVILSYARTPMGSFAGTLAGASATQLGATAVTGAVDRSGVKAEAIERIYMGCVPGARAPGGDRRRARHACRGHDRQQDVRFGHAGGDHGA
jgi:acetyl-CoA acetyltransferase